MGAVLVDVAEDVRALHRLAEGDGGAACGIQIVGAEQGRHQEPDGASDPVAVAIQIGLGGNAGTREVVAHSGAEVVDDGRLDGVSRRQVVQDPSLAARDGAVDGPLLDRLNGADGITPAEIHGIVERAQHEVEQVHVIADLARE